MQDFPLRKVAATKHRVPPAAAECTGTLCTASATTGTQPPQCHPVAREEST